VRGSLQARIDSIPRFLRFAIVGCAGYVVDVAALYVAIYGLGAGPYLGRVFSYLCAASATWYMNRHFTFADANNKNLTREWLKFVALNSAGGLVNYVTYATYIHFIASTSAGPALGVALGSLSGLGVNYVLSHRLVFRVPADQRSPR
jgi:putative flippase GtrA